MAVNNIPKPDETVNEELSRTRTGYYQQYYDKNKEKISLKSRLYRERNLEHISLRKKKWAELNKDKLKRKWAEYGKTEERKLSRKNYRELNKDKISEQKKISYQKHKKRIHDKKKAYTKQRRRTDPTYKLVGSLRNRLGQLLKSRSERSSELLGCSPALWQKHLESKFYGGMSWGTYGHGAGCWTIDHIIPLALFDLRCPLARRVAFGFENTQPMWSSENYSKQHRKSSLS